PRRPPAASTRTSGHRSATTSDPTAPRPSSAAPPAASTHLRRFTMGYEITHWIGGQDVATAGSTQPIMNPATGAEVGTLHLGDADTVDQAVRSAAEAQREWAKVSLAKRTQILFRMRQLMLDNTDEIAVAISREHGKTIGDAKGEIARGLETLEFAT